MLIKIAAFITYFIGGLYLVFIPVMFGYAHNYQAMWCTLILGIIGFFMVVAILPWYDRELKKDDKKPDTIPDINVLHAKVDKINLDSATTKLMMNEFLIQIRHAMKV